jgi:hypothetical protein
LVKESYGLVEADNDSFPAQLVAVTHNPISDAVTGISLIVTCAPP